MATEFNFVNTNASEIYNKVIKELMDSVNEPLYPGDERRIYGEALVFVLVSVYNDLNDAAKQRTLQYARGAVLDALGERVGAKRLESTSAYDVFRFRIEQAVANNIIIPQGTRVTPDGSVYFATSSTAVLQSGEVFVDVEAVCTIAGSDYNGFNAETITTLVDLIPYISAVSNLYGTLGGDNGEAYTVEGDDRYRERIKLAPSTFSVAGPRGAYRYYALSADPEIVDVYIDSPSANIIVIIPLMKNGEIPDQETMDKIFNVFGDDIRPMSDVVQVEAPEVIEYDINIKYYCALENEADAIKAVETSGGAIDIYKAWQSTALGQSINPDQLKKNILISSDGTEVVTRVDVISPSYLSLNKNQVAKFSGNLVVSHELE